MCPEKTIGRNLTGRSRIRGRIPVSVHIVRPETSDSTKMTEKSVGIGRRIFAGLVRRSLDE
jgi:hypothetical protein